MSDAKECQSYYLNILSVEIRRFEYFFFEHLNNPKVIIYLNCEVILNELPFEVKRRGLLSSGKEPAAAKVKFIERIWCLLDHSFEEKAKKDNLFDQTY